MDSGQLALCLANIVGMKKKEPDYSIGFQQALVVTYLDLQGIDIQCTITAVKCGSAKIVVNRTSFPGETKVLEDWPICAEARTLESALGTATRKICCDKQVWLRKAELQPIEEFTIKPIWLLCQPKICLPNQKFSEVILQRRWEKADLVIGLTVEGNTVTIAETLGTRRTEYIDSFLSFIAEQMEKQGFTPTWDKMKLVVKGPSDKVIQSINKMADKTCSETVWTTKS